MTNLDFTFGIVTAYDNSHMLTNVVNSIIAEQIPNYEIILVGTITDYNLPWPIKSISQEKYIVEHPDSNVVTLIDFNKNIKPKWITKKKNIATDNARYENIVAMHDYMKLEQGWYNGFCEFGDNWDVCMNKVLNLDGTRFRDWLSCSDPIYCESDRFASKVVPYTYNRTRWMYVSGSYFVAKTEFLKQYRFNEQLCWGQGEDFEWSQRIRTFWNYKMNTLSAVKLLKQKEDFTPIMPEHELLMVDKINSYEDRKIYNLI